LKPFKQITNKLETNRRKERKTSVGKKFKVKIQVTLQVCRKKSGIGRGIYS